MSSLPQVPFSEPSITVNLFSDSPFSHIQKAQAAQAKESTPHKSPNHLAMGRRKNSNKVANVPIFIAEIMPKGMFVLMRFLGFEIPILKFSTKRTRSKNLRGRFTAVHQLMICLGVSLTYLIGAFVNWQTLALNGTITCLVQLIGLSFIPESPRWLISREKECEAALQCLRGGNDDISFQRKYARSLIVGVGLMVLQQFRGVNGISFYASAIFISAGRNGLFPNAIYLCLIRIRRKMESEYCNT
ncbi:Sugar transporter ERD6-like 5 [Morella rubra]|uniref:Sugar transporter ERD6-like 5 n=1 Tax=Morella rubra TaxID=262757 RepID=A0A6A1W9C4_9ROSI|nr:Sugar transporter ERD6-like 5 [Morella rubra]